MASSPTVANPVPITTTRRLRVDHYGPDERFVGGMASVLTVLRTEQVGADIVTTHSTWVPDNARGTLRAWLQALVSVGRLPRGAVVHVHVADGGSFVRKGLLLWCARARRLKTVATIHGPTFCAFAERKPWLVRAALRGARAVTVLTPDALDVVQKLVPGVLARQIPNPVPLDLVTVDAGDAPLNLLFAGEVGTRKGVDVLLAAWPRVRTAVPESTLTIAGPEADVHPTPQDGLIVLGPKPSSEVRRLMRASRAVVLPSRAEAMPMVLLEAGACARPFVGTPVGSVSLLAAEGGVVVPVEDEDALADALIGLLTDAARSTELGSAGHAAAARRSPEAVDEELQQLYRDIGAAQ